MMNGKKHRRGKPAVILYNEDGSIKEEHWFVRGRRKFPLTTEHLF